MEKLSNKIAKNIISLRKEQKLTQQELANMVGCSRGHISCIELGRDYFSVKTLYKICLALKCNIDDILPNKFNHLTIET